MKSSITPMFPMPSRWSRFKLQLLKDYRSWLLIGPSLILFSFFIWVPLLSNVYLSFFDSVGFNATSFVGFANYRAILQDSLFLTALTNTVSYTLWSLLIGFIIPIVLAILVSEMVHFKGLFKTGLYIPNVVPGIATVILWTLMMDPNPGGFFNLLLAQIGVDPQPWLSNPDMAIPLIILTMTWKGAGATMLIYLATLQTVDPTYYDAARLEGANLWQRFWYVTLPYLMNNVKLLFILQIISVFQVFYEPFVMTHGGPNNATLSLTQLMHRYAFIDGNASYGAALGVIISLILMVLSVIYHLLSRDKGETHQ